MLRTVTPRFAGAAGRTGPRHRSRRRRRAGRGDSRPLPRGGRVHARLDASAGAEGLRREHRGVLNASMGFDEADARAHLSCCAWARRANPRGSISPRGWACRRTLIDRARARHVDQRARHRAISRRTASSASTGSADRRTSWNSRSRRWRRASRQLAKDWEQREAAKLREIEERCDRAIAGFEAQARETIDRIAEAARPAQGRRPGRAQSGARRARISGRRAG